MYDHLSPAIRRYGAWFWVWQPSATGEKVVFISTSQNPCHCFVLCLFGKQVKSNDWVINHNLDNFIVVEKNMVMSLFWSQCQYQAAAAITKLFLGELNLLDNDVGHLQALATGVFNQSSKKRSISMSITNIYCVWILLIHSALRAKLTSAGSCLHRGWKGHWGPYQGLAGICYHFELVSDGSMD